MAVDHRGEALICLAFAFYTHTEKPTIEKFESLFVTLKTNKDIVAVHKETEKKTTIPKGTVLTKDVYKTLDESSTLVTMDDFDKIPEATILANIRDKYGDHLGSNFPYSILTVFPTYSPRHQKRKDWLQVKQEDDERIAIAFKMTEQAIEGNIFPSDMSSYVFLPQNDPFSIMVKDRSMDKLREIFGHVFSGESELYNPVDMFFVKKGYEQKILDDLKTNFLNLSKNEIQANMLSENKKDQAKTYREIIVKYFKKSALFPISLKFMKSKSTTPRIKVIGETKLRGKKIEDVDPYTIVLSKIIAKDMNVEKFIKNFIHIRFNEFNFDKASWEYPVDFNYEGYLKGSTNMTFILMSWKGGVFNGQWIMEGNNTRTTWSGGMGGGPTSNVLFKYSDFRSTILKEIKQIRIKALKDMVDTRQFYDIQKAIPASKAGKDTTKFQIESSTMEKKFKSALNELNGDRILMKENLPLTVEFFRAYSIKHPKVNFEAYCRNAASALLHGFKHNFSDNTDNMEKFKHAQFSYFLFHWGNNGEHELQVKKQIFMSIFGVLTKSAYKIFDKNEMSNLVRKKFNGKEVYYRETPFVLMSY